MIPVLGYLVSLVAMMASAVLIDTGATLVGPDEPGTLVKGPSSKATVKGPSGPIIATAGDTGAVSSARKTGGVVSAGPSDAGSVLPLLPLGPAIVPVSPIAALVAPAIPIAVPEPILYREPEPTIRYDPLPQYTVPLDTIPLSAGYYGKTIY